MILHITIIAISVYMAGYTTDRAIRITYLLVALLNLYFLVDTWLK